MADLTVSKEAGIYTISAGTPAGREWLAENVHQTDIAGSMFTGAESQVFLDDRQYAWDIVHAAIADGLEVR